MKKTSISLAIIFLFSLQCFAQTRFIDIQGTKVWINTIGVEERRDGEPVIVFESGHGTPMGNWDRVILILSTCVRDLSLKGFVLCQSARVAAILLFCYGGLHACKRHSVLVQNFSHYVGFSMHIKPYVLLLGRR